jgi:hypothetical protein
MATKKKHTKAHPNSRKHRRNHTHHQLFGLSVSKQKVGDASMHSGLQVVTLIIGGAIGAAIGKPSLLAGLPVVFAGNYKNHAYLTTLGLGMVLSNGFNALNSANAAPATPAVNGMEGIDPSAMLHGAKDRVMVFLHSFADKLYIPHTTPAANPATPLKGLGSTDVSYFFNPYNKDNQVSGPPDMSALDRVSEQIALLASSNPPSQNQPQSPLQGAEDMELNFDEDMSGTLADIQDTEANF